MEPTLNEDTVRHVAELAKLHLQSGEVARFGAQLSKILGYVAKLSELDTQDVEPTTHPIALATALRADEVRPSWPSEEALANAPERDNGFFRVPKVLDQGSD